MGDLVKQHEEADVLLVFSGLLQLLDSPHHIEVDETAVLAAGLQSLPEPPKLLSTVFIDVIPKMFESRNETVIRSWGYLLLRKSVEGIYITCSKQLLEEPHMNWVEDDIATAMRGITRLLLCDIAFDIKTLILTTCSLFFTRFPKRVIAVLAFQVITMIDFMTNAKPGDTHTAHIRSFLRTAFRAYAARGLFTLLWKHEMITKTRKKSRIECLAEVMNDGLDAVTHDEVLADLPIKDILRQGLKTPKEYIGPIFTNFCSFIAQARFSNLPLLLLDSIGHFLNKLSRHFTDSHDWSTEAVNFDPLFNMVAVLLSHNKPSNLQV
ncbi:hypothetical protein CROQUDRAFT_625716 [Cronartium quercuum f. sp. fusiforme G11]|uniref:Uncharacterized protein n=1 Tax=Cronartium quercuum f. sp. fusiforme G11 TaxID=708437 RepID=A0A9P6NIT0_9BASI|nr:hypothetical protein CROQUDRAFT_625716 [Cronartium quercuum f. sp. fusiforme G11]